MQQGPGPKSNKFDVSQTYYINLIKIHQVGGMDDSVSENIMPLAAYGLKAY